MGAVAKGRPWQTDALETHQGARRKKNKEQTERNTFQGRAVFHKDESSWLTMVHSDASSRFVMMNHNDESSRFIMMNCNGSL